MTELKPCPFCGHPALFEPFKERKGYAATVRCGNCLAEITTITYDTEEEAEKEALFAWNRRANNGVDAKKIIDAIYERWGCDPGYYCAPDADLEFEAKRDSYIIEILTGEKKQ